MLSLYLDLTPNDRGRDDYRTFVRRAFADRVTALPPGSLERASFERDVSRIEQFLATSVAPSANGLAIFACAADGAFFDRENRDVDVGCRFQFPHTTSDVECRF